MVCDGLETLIDNSITGILAFPTSCDYYFYAKIMFAFFVIIAFGVSRAERDNLGKSDMISAMGISAIATIFIALIGTLISIIQPDVFIGIFVVGIVFIVIWLLKN